LKGVKWGQEFLCPSSIRGRRLAVFWQRAVGRACKGRVCGGMRKDIMADMWLYLRRQVDLCGEPGTVCFNNEQR
jgi:hypothetical protein